MSKVNKFWGTRIISVSVNDLMLSSFFYEAHEIILVHGA